MARVRFAPGVAPDISIGAAFSEKFVPTAFSIIRFSSNSFRTFFHVGGLSQNPTQRLRSPAGAGFPICSPGDLLRVKSRWKQEGAPKDRKIQLRGCGSRWRRNLPVCSPEDLLQIMFRRKQRGGHWRIEGDLHRVTNGCDLPKVRTLKSGHH